MKDMFGSAWERVLRSLSEREFQEELDALFQKSNLIQPIEMVLRASFQQVGLTGNINNIFRLSLIHFFLL